jgi:hypothetical protein
MNMIVCIGGTGQMVLHYYLQLYLLGVIKHPFDAVVIDTDEIISSIQVVQRFLKDLQYGPQESEALGATLPVLKTIRVGPRGGDTAFEVLTGVRDWGKVEPHPARAFFNKDTLLQNPNQGLFARPALSSVLSQEYLRSPDLTPKPNSIVVIVGSVIGGTGGGLIAPIIDEIRRRVVREAINNVTIRAVLFGEYFRPEPGRIEGDVIRFQSNQMWVLRSIREALEELHSFYIVGGPEFRASLERKPEDEKIGEHLPWPEDKENPFWRGAQALEYLLIERVQQRALEFEDREIVEFDPPFTLQSARLRLNNALQVVKRLIDKEVVVRMANDPWSRWIWGDKLTDMVTHFWNIAASMEGGEERVKNFPRNVQDALESLWKGSGEQRGLRTVFPRLSKFHRVGPGSIRRIRWPEVREGNWERRLFDGPGEAARRAAATLLFWTLREGV